VQVLEHQQDGPALAQPGEDAEEVLEQWPGTLRCPGAATTEQGADVREARTEEFDEDILAKLRPQVAQRLDERRVGNGYLAQLEAATERGDEPVAACLLDGGGHQPGLADARVTGEQHHTRLAVCRRLRRRAQSGQLVGTSDQLAAAHPARHVREHKRKPPAIR
jgi:hypothetical protein